jgi:ParB-like chromosome segregation protein Spo0J
LRLAWRAGLQRWPEYAELDCFACHHDLTAPKDSWRQMEGYPGRRPGTPPWNAARYAVFRYVAEQVNPELEGQLRSSIIKLAQLMAHPAGNGTETAQVAQDAAKLADQIARELDAHHYDQRFTLQLMRSIVAGGEEIAQQGERAAEQAYMSLDSLFNAYRQSGKPANDGDIQGAISGLIQQFNNPSAYSAPKFAAQMQKVHSALARETPLVGSSK